jgi:2-polyprenyl-3-methyl-5-hydroxy-6-metoxy-1,4-benzoquinol methylase
MFFENQGVVYTKCNNCSLVYQNPMPVFADLKKRYGEGYFDYEVKNQDNFFELMKLGLKDIQFDRFYDGVNNRKFLDIGCATGLLLHHMKKKGWNTVGVEICRPSVDYARRNFGLEIFTGTLQDAQFPSNHFDVVHFSHLIEHVPDPKGLLNEVKRIVKNNGHVIVTTPNVDGLQAKIARENWRSAIPDHIHLFSKKTMRLLFDLTGYKVVKQISWGGIPSGKRPGFIKHPADKLAKLLNLGDVMLFHCRPV